MIARRFEDLIVWQLAYELQQEVFAFTATRPSAADFRFCDQIRESSRSSPRNIAEGFGRYYPKEFARFLRIATASLHETKNHLRDGRDRGYLSDAEFERLMRLSLRSIRAANRLIAYLHRCTPPEPFDRSSPGYKPDEP